ncbi:DUF1768 domain-containing protein [bacterium]|nr:DUF1768 domain-containing protein [bacterium]
MPGQTIIFPTVEHAYQACKSTSALDWDIILNCLTPGAAKKAGRKFHLRADWDEARLSVMERLLWQKFTQHEFARKLVQIDGKIEEGNNWHDTFWGVDLATGEGFNHLGRLLMKVRDGLRG